MKINSIILENFRNYRNLELDFDESRNIIVGENAQGKTNLVEAIYMTAFARSFRTNNSADLIMFGEDSARVCTDITSEVKAAPFGWTSDTQENFLEYAIPLGDKTGLSLGDTVHIIVTASLGWGEGNAVVDACPNNAVEYNDGNHLSVTYNFNEGISYEIKVE